MGLGYVINKVKRLNVKGLWQALGRLHKKTGRSRLRILWDMLGCARRHGAGYIDYENCGLYLRTEAERATYLTGGRNAALWAKYNDPSQVDLLENKAAFAARFPAAFGRDWALVADDKRADLLAFLQKHTAFMLKPMDGCCGRGIRRFTQTAPPEQTLETLLTDHQGWLCEQLIVQHPALAAVNPDAINTLRAVTLLKGGKPQLVCTYWRIGGAGESVDNFNHGGMVVPVDRFSGRVEFDAVDKKGQCYATHPATGAAIAGFAFPDWERACALVLACAEQLPRLGYIGWDVAFTPDGPCLVEGNPYPGHDIYQLIVHTKDGKGIYPDFVE